MIEKKIDISNLTNLDELLDQITSTTEIILTKGSTPIAKVIPITNPTLSISERVPDLHPGVWLSPDFEDLLPDKYWKTREV